MMTAVREDDVFYFDDTVIIGKKVGAIDSITVYLICLL